MVTGEELFDLWKRTIGRDQSVIKAGWRRFWLRQVLVFMLGGVAGAFAAVIFL